MSSTLEDQWTKEQTLGLARELLYQCWRESQPPMVDGNLYNGGLGAFYLLYQFSQLEKHTAPCTPTAASLTTPTSRGHGRGSGHDRGRVGSFSFASTASTAGTTPSPSSTVRKRNSLRPTTPRLGTTRQPPPPIHTNFAASTSTSASTPTATTTSTTTTTTATPSISRLHPAASFDSVETTDTSAGASIATYSTTTTTTTTTTTNATHTPRTNTRSSRKVHTPSIYRHKRPLQQARDGAKMAISNLPYQNPSCSVNSAPAPTLLWNDSMGAYSLLAVSEYRLGNMASSKDAVKRIYQRIQNYTKLQQSPLPLQDASLLMGHAGILQIIWFLRNELEAPKLCQKVMVPFVVAILLQGKRNAFHWNMMEQQSPPPQQPPPQQQQQLHPNTAATSITSTNTTDNSPVTTPELDSTTAAAATTAASSTTDNETKNATMTNTSKNTILCWTNTSSHQSTTSSTTTTTTSSSSSKQIKVLLGAARGMIGILFTLLGCSPSDWELIDKQLAIATPGETPQTNEETTKLSTSNSNGTETATSTKSPSSSSDSSSSMGIGKQWIQNTIDHLLLHYRFEQSKNIKPYICQKTNKNNHTTDENEHASDVASSSDSLSHSHHQHQRDHQHDHHHHQPNPWRLDWSQGACGLVLLLLRAGQVFANEHYLQEAAWLCEHVLWKTRKDWSMERGVGLAHGCSATALCFLQLAQYSVNPNKILWQRRAEFTLKWALQHLQAYLQMEQENPTGWNVYGLYEGCGGLVSVMMQLHASADEPIQMPLFCTGYEYPERTLLTTSNDDDLDDDDWSDESVEEVKPEPLVPKRPPVETKDTTNEDTKLVPSPAPVVIEVPPLSPPPPPPPLPKFGYTGPTPSPPNAGRTHYSAANNGSSLFWSLQTETNIGHAEGYKPALVETPIPSNGGRKQIPDNHNQPSTPNHGDKDQSSTLTLTSQQRCFQGSTRPSLKCDVRP